METMRLRRTKLLPYSGKVMVSPGDSVTAGQLLAEVDFIPGPVRVVPVAKLLSVPRDRMADTLVKLIGARLSQGEVVAVNSVLNQISACVSPCNGTLSMVSRTLGNVYLREPIAIPTDDLVVYDVGLRFAVAPEDAEKYVLVRAGDIVIPGQPVARLSTKAVAGLEAKGFLHNYISSDVYGRVISVRSGKVRVATRLFTDRVLAPFDGKVVQVIPGRGAIVEGVASQLQGVYGLGGERTGVLKVRSNVSLLQSDEIVPEDVGCIIVTPGSITLAALQKASELGVAGIVAGYADFRTVYQFAGQGFTPAVTGGEPVNTAVMLLEGFVPGCKVDGIVKRLSKYEGRQVMMSGATHIRAGAIRPELLLPGQASTAEQSLPSQRTQVQILRGQHHGRTGTLHSISSAPVLLPSGVRALLAEVDLLDGGRVSIPAANLRNRSDLGTNRKG